MYISMQNLWFSLQYVIQLFSADATMFKKGPRGTIFQLGLGRFQTRPNIKFYSIKMSYRATYIMTLNVLVSIVMS